jgi:hypothetical protein
MCWEYQKLLFKDEPNIDHNIPCVSVFKLSCVCDILNKDFGDI